MDLSHIGQILDVPFPRPRDRMEVVNHPNYYSLAEEVIYFNQQKRARSRQSKLCAIARNGLEKVNLEIGFVPLTDCAPLLPKKRACSRNTDVILSRTELEERSRRCCQRRLDAAQMIAGMIAMT